MPTKTLHVTVESTAAFFEEALAVVRQLEQAAAVDDRYVLSLPDDEALERVVCADNLELLRTIAAEEPESLQELARQVDMDNVSTAVARLEELGLVELVETGSAKQPTVWYDRLAIDVPLTAADTDGTNVEPA